MSRLKAPSGPFLPVAKVMHSSNLVRHDPLVDEFTEHESNRAKTHDSYTTAGDVIDYWQESGQ
jgi:hypothetical protein